MSDADVVEISELPTAALKKAAAAAKKKKAKQAKKTQKKGKIGILGITCLRASQSEIIGAAKKEVIVIDGDEDSESDDDLMIIDEKDFLKKNVKEEVNDHPTEVEGFQEVRCCVRSLRSPLFERSRLPTTGYLLLHVICIAIRVSEIAVKSLDEENSGRVENPGEGFARVYETRMDLLRAVILGADGTPYHDGAFFFDVFFPADYPNSPPHVYYHSGGLRLNPNLYVNGYVCLSLLNTWQGNSNQRWRPGYSTTLQVLVSIQGLVLNAKPYFNEPRYEKPMGTASGEKSSYEYTENTSLIIEDDAIYSQTTT
ncbi:putative ubiquitin-conjugating enzyme E2 25 [Drosera capensis]